MYIHVLAHSPENPTLIKVLTYDYVPDILEKRGPHRQGHIDGAKVSVLISVCLHEREWGPDGLSAVTLPRATDTNRPASPMTRMHHVCAGL